MQPRVPVMVEIAGADAPIGTPFEKLEALQERYRDLDVRIEWLRKEAPRFHLRLERYRIAERPVTQADFALYLAETGRRDDFQALTARPDRNDHPARMNLDDARAYIDWLTHTMRRGFRLPTEFEWEFAAAGPASHAFPWGDQYVEGLANTTEAGHGDTRPVDALADNVSWCGVFDMAGNAEEWTASVYRPYPGGNPVRDTFNADGGDYTVTRGGSFKLGRDCARCQRRHGALPDAAIGLRLAESV